MFTVTLQVKRPSLDWNASPKVEHIFKDWQEVSVFAYRLAKQTTRETRVEYKGNGSYYSPDFADEFLKVKNYEL